MNKIGVLTALLVAQLALAYFFGESFGRLEAFRPDTQLITVASDSVTEIALHEAEGEELIVRKSASGWVLPNYHNAPVSEERVSSFLEKLRSIERPYPTALTETAAIKLKVTDDRFERKITLKTADGSYTLLFGSSPTFRRVHVRLLDEQEIFEIPFDTFEISAEPSEWFHTGALYLQKDEVTAIETPNFRIVEEDGAYRLVDVPEGHVMNEEAVKAYVNQIRAVSFIDLAPKDEAGNAAEQGDEETLVIKVERKSGEPIVYSFTVADEGRAYLTVSDKPFRFEVSASTFESLSLDKDHLLIDQVESEEEESETEAGDASEVEAITHLEEVTESEEPL